MKKRVVLVVLDSAGIGAQPDAADFGDVGANTIGNISKKLGDRLKVPNMRRLGLANIPGAELPPYPGPITGCYGRSLEKTRAKDTTCGHWEMCGIIMDEPFQTYPNGFPKRVIEEFERRIGCGTLGNVVASGTAIIQKLGDEHVATGKPIVYTSADSVFQIAAHESVIPLCELYAMCQTAREMLVGRDLVGRVIARPFIGENGKYTRTENRKDYAVPPTEDTILDGLQQKGLVTVGIGKIEDIFCKRGLGVIDHTKNNHDGFEATLKHLGEDNDFIFANLVDFDMLYGHRNDVVGYAEALNAFDARLPELLEALSAEDLLIITADHGCDPTDEGTDHTREHIPILTYCKTGGAGVDIGTRKSFADIGSTVFEYLTGSPWSTGESFLGLIK